MARVPGPIMGFFQFPFFTINFRRDLYFLLSCLTLYVFIDHNDFCWAQIHGFHRSSQIQGFHRNAINKAKSSPELIHKGAGSGWGAGRGKRKDNIYHGSSEHTGSSINFPVGHGERLDHDIGDLRISDSRQGFKSYGRAQLVNTNLWPSRNSPMSAPPCGQGLTVNKSHTWQRNQSPVANPSMQAHGRGLYIPVWC
ncbi:hypothetical protein CsSME_00040369 [Camellia sinensis var. sinensis]